MITSTDPLFVGQQFLQQPHCLRRISAVFGGSRDGPARTQDVGMIPAKNPALSSSSS